MNPLTATDRAVNAAAKAVAHPTNLAAADPLALRVGVLAVQGDYARHRQMISALGFTAVEVRTVEQLRQVHCLIMPGGESTTMRKLLKLGGLWDAIPEFARSHAIMGTCAGLILLGHAIIHGRPDEDTLDLIDIDSDRNAYGSQFHSFRQAGEVSIDGAPRGLEMVFIRAPRIDRIGPQVEVLGRLGDEPTLVRQGNILALTFHPEMTESAAVHSYFLNQVAAPALARR